MPPLIKLESLVEETPLEIIQVEGGMLTLGRELDNGIVIDSESVSRRHGCLAAAGTQWVYRDLHSTNCSWVNGVQVKAGQIRLLRDGDVIQLADFPLRVVESGRASDVGPRLPSVLVFERDRFIVEQGFELDGERFVVGGPQADFYLAGEDKSIRQLVIVNRKSRLEISTETPSVSVVVNDMVSVGGAAVLSDRDEITAGNYKMVINDLRSATLDASSARPQGASPPAVRAPRAGERAYASPYFRGGGSEGEPKRTRVGTSKPIIFAGQPTGGQATETLSIQARRLDSRMGFDLSSSQRFSGAFIPEEESRFSLLREHIQTIVGAIIFAIFLGLAIFYFIKH